MVFPLPDPDDEVLLPVEEDVEQAEAVNAATATAPQKARRVGRRAARRDAAAALMVRGLLSQDRAAAAVIRSPLDTSTLDRNDFQNHRPEH
jgi:hypothetical protein